MLEAVEALIELLELERKLLTEGRELPPELLSRLQLAGDSVSEVVERLRPLQPEKGDPEARRLKETLEARFVVAFRLTRETEKLLRDGPPPPPSAAGPRPASARPSLREIERRYRERMRHEGSP